MCDFVNKKKKVEVKAKKLFHRMALRRVYTVQQRLLRSGFHHQLNSVKPCHQYRRCFASDSNTDGNTSGRWSRFGKIFNWRSKKQQQNSGSNEDSSRTRTSSGPKTVRAGKTPLPSAEEGVMQHIPREKAQILHILQNECDLYPDEVFPLFPDHKVEDILIEYQEKGDVSIEYEPLTKALPGSSRPEHQQAMIDATRTSEQDIMDKSLESDEKEAKYLDESTVDEQEDAEDGELDETTTTTTTTGKIALGKIETAKIPASEAIDGSEKEGDGDKEIAKLDDEESDISKGTEEEDDKTSIMRPLTASQKRQQRVSQITGDTRHQRELDPFVTFRETKILTPDEVALLHLKEKQTPRQKKRRMTLSQHSEATLIRLKNGMLVEKTKDDSGTKVHEVWNQDPDNVYEIIQLLTEHGFKSDQNNNIWPYSEFERMYFCKGEVL